MTSERRSALAFVVLAAASALLVFLLLAPARTTAWPKHAEDWFRLPGGRLVHLDEPARR
jgi:hypothetical protein